MTVFKKITDRFSGTKKRDVLYKHALDAAKAGDAPTATALIQNLQRDYASDTYMPRMVSHVAILLAKTDPRATLHMCMNQMGHKQPLQKDIDAILRPTVLDLADQHLDVKKLEDASQLAMLAMVLAQSATTISDLRSALMMWGTAFQTLAEKDLEDRAVAAVRNARSSTSPALVDFATQRWTDTLIQLSKTNVLKAVGLAGMPFVRKPSR